MKVCAFAARAAASTSSLVASGLPYKMLPRIEVANSAGSCTHSRTPNGGQAHGSQDLLPKAAGAAGARAGAGPPLCTWQAELGTRGGRHGQRTAPVGYMLAAVTVTVCQAYTKAQTRFPLYGLRPRRVFGPHLRDKTELRAQPAQLQCAQVVAVQADHAGLRVVEPAQRSRAVKRRTGARGSNKMREQARSEQSWFIKRRQAALD